jgi:hypothetical protein
MCLYNPYQNMVWEHNYAFYEKMQHFTFKLFSKLDVSSCLRERLKLQIWLFLKKNMIQFVRV